MKPVARFGDKCTGTCFAHTTPISVGGTIISGSTDTLTNGKPTARLGDKVQADCGHTSTIVSGSPTVLTNGKPTARLGDSVSGPYVATIISGSPDCFTS